MLESRAARAVGFSALVASALGPLCGCARVAVRTTAKALDRGACVFDAEPDPAFAEQAMPAQLKTVEALLQTEPESGRLLDLAAQGYAGYALLFLENAQPDRARDFYKRALDFGLRALALRGLKDLRALSPSAVEAELAGRGAKDVRPLFWTALAWAGWINLAKDDPDALADLPRAAALMQAVERIAPDYYHGGPSLLLAVYYGRPKTFGGDPARSKAYFEKAAASSQGRFLMTWVRYARVYAAGTQDRALFDSLVKRVLDAPADVLPEARLANEIAKRQAKYLQEHANDYFE